MSEEEDLAIKDTLSKEESNNDSTPKELATPLNTN